MKVALLCVCVHVNPLITIGLYEPTLLHHEHDSDCVISHVSVALYVHPPFQLPFCLTQHFTAPQHCCVVLCVCVRERSRCVTQQCRRALFLVPVVIICFIYFGVCQELTSSKLNRQNVTRFRNPNKYGSNLIDSICIF